MAQVPVYGGTQVERGALRPAMQSPIDVSSGTQALARGIDQAAGVLEAKIVRDAETEVNRIDEEITAGWLQWKAENQRNFQGEKAGDFTAAAEDWWTKAGQKYATQGQNPMVGRALDRTLGRKRGRAMVDVTEYVNAEGERFADSKAEAASLREIEFGIDTGDTASAGQRVRAINAQKAARKGWTADQLEVENQRLLGAMHLSMIEKLAQTDAAKASAYYNDDRVKREIPLTAQNKVEQVLKAEGDNQFATKFAAERADKPLTEQLKDAATINDPERREKTIAQVRNTFALKRQAQQEQEAEASDQAWQLASQGRRVPESTLLRMNGRERAQLKDWLREKAKQAAEGTPVKTDWATYVDVRERLAAGEDVDLRRLTTKIAGPQMEQLLDVKTKAKTPGKQDSMLTDEQRISQALTGLGIDKKKDPERAGQIAQEIDRRVRVESAARGGKDLTADEKQKLIDAVVTDKVYVDRFGPDGDAQPIVMLKPDEIDKAYVNVNGKDIKVSAVPRADREQIITALRAVGALPTEQAIVALYLKKHGQLPVAPKKAIAE
jgi:hypothetical protein